MGLNKHIISLRESFGLMIINKTHYRFYVYMILYKYMREGKYIYCNQSICFDDLNDNSYIYECQWLINKDGLSTCTAEHCKYMMKF